MSLSFSHLWKQREHSDVDVLLLAPSQHSRDKLVLMILPGHSALLSNSEVFRAKLLRWQDDMDPYRRSSKYARSGSTDRTPRGEIELELQGTSELEAALAVLQSLYAVKPLPELLAELSQEQQLQAAVLADKWQVPHVSSAAAELLVDAAKTEGALVGAVQQRVLRDAALPECLQPLLKSVLLSLLGDLEAVWADRSLRDTLLGLPLHAMVLLLSCDELKAASKDTVLFTAEQYVDHIWSSCEPTQRDFAEQQLARQIRCPHLSRYWLAGSVAAEEAYLRLLADLRPQLRRLLLVREAQADYSVQSADLREGQLLAGAPASWALGRRVVKPVGSVQLVWQLDVSKVREAARHSFASQTHKSLFCPEASPPLGGMAFGIKVVCESAEGGVKFGLYCGPEKLPKDMCYKATFKLAVEGYDSLTHVMSKPEGRSTWRGYSNFFGLGPMAEGWDEVAWAGQGLPTGGKLTIKVTVSELSHAPNLQR